MKCKWVEAWVGVCNKDCDESGFCQEHKKKCSSCGETATHSCDATGQFVCGEALCDNCEHTIHTDSTNGGIGFFQSAPLPKGLRNHCKKTKQKCKPWYEETDQWKNSQIS